MPLLMANSTKIAEHDRYLSMNTSQPITAAPFPINTPLWRRSSISRMEWQCLKTVTCLL